MSTAIQAPAPADTRVRRPGSLVLLAIIVLAAAISGYRVLTIRPVLWGVLTEFDVGLPAVTHFVMTAWFVLIFPALALLAICLDLFRYRRAMLVNSLILLTIYLLWELFVEAMVTPFMMILNRLTG